MSYVSLPKFRYLTEIFTKCRSEPLLHSDALILAWELVIKLVLARLAGMNSLKKFSKSYDAFIQLIFVMLIEKNWPIVPDILDTFSLNCLFFMLDIFDTFLEFFNVFANLVREYCYRMMTD